jgi:flagellar motor switch protein FliM
VAQAFPAELFAMELSARLTRLMGGVSPSVESAPPSASSARKFGAQIGIFAANTVFAVGAAEMPLSLSIDAEAVLRLLDRTFGGRGEPPKPLPRIFPLSAELLIERLDALVSEALVAAIGGTEPSPVHVLRRHASFAQLAPFVLDEELTVHEFTIGDPDTAGRSWTMLIAFPTLRYAAAEGAEQPGKVSRSAGDASAAPYAEIPLTLGALLIEMRLPLSRLASLKVGDVLPVALARTVPLYAGGRRIAAGTVGNLDDRIAVQLTEAF